MANSFVVSPRWPRALALLCIAGLGLVSIVGSGGGAAGGADCSFFSDVCNPVVNQPTGIPLVTLSPQRLTAQAGATATYTAEAVGIGQPHYQWQRSSDGGLTYVDVAGATDAAYTLANTLLEDDGAVFRVAVRTSVGGAVDALSNAGVLLVSSLPPVVFEDGDFQPADWLASAIADPAQGGPTHSEERVDTGGVPGAFRKMTHVMSAGASSLRVFNALASATYSPAAQGAVHAIDYSEDCDRLSASAATMEVTSYLLIEQGARRYVSSLARGCLALWVKPTDGPSLQAPDFALVDGPACAANESCPDFSANGQPMRFGFERRVVQPAASASAATIEHGIDNWKVAVWRE